MMKVLVIAALFALDVSAVNHKQLSHIKMANRQHLQSGARDEVEGEELDDNDMHNDMNDEDIIQYAQAMKDDKNQTRATLPQKSAAPANSTSLTQSKEPSNNETKKATLH